MKKKSMNAAAWFLQLSMVLVLLVGFTGTVMAQSSTFSDKLLRVGINADCSELGPFSGGSNGRNSMVLTIYQTLGDLDGVGGPLVNIVMKSYKEVTENNFNIEIWSNVYDTAGNHITAADVVWCHQMAIKAAKNTNVRYIKSIEATGDYTLKLVLNADFVGGFENVVKIVPIVSRTAYEASPDGMATKPVGTTPYKLTAFVPGSSATFEKASTYWQKDPAARAAQRLYGVANVDKIVYTTIKEASQMSIALETGAIDLGLSMEAVEAKRFMGDGKSAKKFTVFQQVTNLGNQMYLSGDATSPFSKSKELRQAVLYAIDKQGLVDGVLGGFGVVEYTFGGDSFSDFNPEWKNEEYYNYNTTKAKALLSKSGYKDATLRIMTDNTSQRNKTAQILQAYMKAIGINSTILQYDSALFNSYKNKPSEWDIMLDNTGSSDYLVTVWRGKFDSRQYKTGTINGWQDPQLQKLLETAISVNGHTTKNVDAFHEYFKEQAYGMGLYNHTFFSVGVLGIKDIMYDAKMFVYAPGVKF